MFGIGFAMLGEELDLVGLQAVVVFERPEELAAGQMIRVFVAAVGRGDLFEDVVAAQRNVHPADPRQYRGRQKIFFDLAALQLLRRHADGIAKAQNNAR